MVKNLPVLQEESHIQLCIFQARILEWVAIFSGSIPGSGRYPGEGLGYLLQYSWASLVAQLKECTCRAGDLGLIPGLGKSPGEGKGYPL